MKARPLVAIGAMSGALVLSAGGLAQAAPAEQSPVGGTHAHAHHVHTGNGGCVDIDYVLFEPAARGLHHAAHNSIAGGRDRLWHGTCAGTLFAGGPPLPSFVPHH